MLNKSSKWRALVIIIVSLVIIFFYRKQDTSPPTSDQSFRNANHLVFTKHARCRMDCRHIDETEIREIIRDGVLNEQVRKVPRDMTYALEGTSHDNQDIRAAVTPQDNGLLVITVIDLKRMGL